MLGKIAFQQFRNANNGISETQRIAIDNGTASAFEKSLMRGAPAWDDFLALPPPGLSADEQSYLDNEVEQYCALINDWQTRSQRGVQDEVLDYARRSKHFGLVIPKDYGGLGFSAYAHGLIMAKIATRSPTIGAMTMVPNSLGPGELLVHYGTEDQKNYFLPRLAGGTEIPCFSLTSPTAGSDATSITDKGVVFKQEDGTLGIRLTFNKRYCTLAPIATLIGLALRLEDPEGLLGDNKEPGITLVLIPRNTPGLNIGDRHSPLGSPFPNGPLSGTNVAIPMTTIIASHQIDSIIGGVKNAGKGWNMLVDCLSIGRSVSLPASASGMGQLSTYATGAYSALRSQFGIRLSQMEGVQESLGRIAGLTYLIDALRTGPLQDMDLANAAGKSARPAIGSTISKLHATALGRQAVIDAMDVHGGKAVMDGPNNPIASMYLAAPTGITVEGANIMGRNLMVFGQVAIMAHPYVMDEMQTSRDVDSGVITQEEGHQRAGQLIRKHLAYVFNNLARSLIMGLTGGIGSYSPRSGPDAKYYRQINRLTSAFAYSANISLMMLAKDMQARQRTAARYGDAYSNLFMAAQVLRRWDMEGRKEADIPLMQWAASHCIHAAEDALHNLIRNHPRRLSKQEKMASGNPRSVNPRKYDIPESLLAKIILRPVVFPRGRLTDKPSDNLDRRLSALISTPSEARDRLTASVYRPKDPADYLARMEQALHLTAQTASTEYAIAQAKRSGTISRSDDPLISIEEALAKNIIGNNDADLLRKAHAARMDIIQVDQFNHDLSGPGTYGPGLKKA